MKIVVDANVLIAALVKASITREVLLYPFLEYYSPAFVFEELKEHEDEIMAKAKLGKAGYKSAVNLLLGNVKIISSVSYSHEMAAAGKIIGAVDKDDVDYVALALSINADGIWSYDSDLKEQRKIKIFSTAELITLIIGKGI
jgi:predicted nucleic acid-binding protein